MTNAVTCKGYAARIADEDEDEDEGEDGILTGHIAAKDVVRSG